MKQCKARPFLEWKWAKLFFLFLGGIANCAGPTVIIEPSRVAEPKWISYIPVQEGYLYFVGSASHADSLELGMLAARHAALSKIAGYHGTDIESQFKLISSETSQEVGEKLKANVEAFVAKAIMVDAYHIKTRRSEGNSILEHFDVFVLLKYPEEEATEEFTRRETESEATANAAYRLYREGEKQESKGRYSEAKRLYHDARELLGQVRTIVTLNQADTPAQTSRELAALLKRREENATRQLRRVIVWISERNRGREHSPSTLASNLEEVLTKHLFTVLDQKMPPGLDVKNFHEMESMNEESVLHTLKAHGAQFLIVGYGDSSYRSLTMKNYFYEAHGTLRVFDTHTRDTILTIPIRNRGYDREEHQAGLNALGEAGQHAGKLLVKELARRESKN